MQEKIGQNFRKSDNDNDGEKIGANCDLVKAWTTQGRLRSNDLAI